MGVPELRAGAATTLGEGADKPTSGGNADKPTSGTTTAEPTTIRAIEAAGATIARTETTDKGAGAWKTPHAIGGGWLIGIILVCFFVEN